MSSRIYKLNTVWQYKGKHLFKICPYCRYITNSIWVNYLITVMASGFADRNLGIWVTLLQSESTSSMTTALSESLRDSSSTKFVSSSVSSLWGGSKPLSNSRLVSVSMIFCCLWMMFSLWTSNADMSFCFLISLDSKRSSFDDSSFIWSAFSRCTRETSTSLNSDCKIS